MTRPLRLDAPVVENRDEGGPHRRLRLRVADWPGFEPGQFVMLSPGARSEAERSDPLLPRPMAVYRAEPCDGGALVEILYKVTGRGTTLLAEARTGERVRMVGPLGRPFPAPAPERPVLLVGGGTGIASLFELAARAADAAPVRVLLGARTAADLMGRGDFEALDLEVGLATEDGSAGRRGLVTELLEEALDRQGAASVYACGPTGMMRRAAELAAAQGGSCCHVSLENTMACGFGVCLGCAVPRRPGGFALVCCDGPVFAAEAVAWAGLP